MPTPRPHRAQASCRPGHRAHHLRDCSPSRGGPKLPLPPPRPARRSAGPSRRAPHRQPPRSRRQPVVPHGRPGQRARARRPSLSRKHPNSASACPSTSATRRGASPASAPPDDIDRLHRRVTELEQHTAEQRRQLAEREDELDATRATNRELMTRLNRQTRTGATSRATPVADARVTPDDA